MQVKEPQFQILQNATLQQRRDGSGARPRTSCRQPNKESADSFA